MHVMSVAAGAIAIGVGLAVVGVPRSIHAQSYPRVTGSGENLEIDYGPMGQGNLVGGGRVIVTMPSGMDVNIMHLDSLFAPRPREGFIPMTIGSGESQETVWVPAVMLETLRRAQANMAPR